MKLTKQQARLHAQAESLLGQDVLSRDDKLFITSTATPRTTSPGISPSCAAGVTCERTVA